MLAKTGDQSAAAALIPVLKDSNPFIRQEAAQALGDLRASIAVDELIEMLNDSNLDTSAVAAEALGKIGDTRSIGPLIDALKTDRRGEVGKSKAAIALGRFGSQAVGPLVKALESPYANTRKGAAEALGEIKDPATIELLINAMKDPAAGRHASSALIDTGTSAFEPLIAALKNPNDRIRSLAAAALGSFHNPAAVLPLIAALKDPAPGTRGGAVWSLQLLSDRRAVLPLCESLSDPDPIVRRGVVIALGAIGDSRAIATLVSVQADPDSIVRENIAIALGRIGGRQAVRPLMSLLRDPDLGVQGSAIESLGKTGKPAVAPLIKLLIGSDRVRRQDVIKALVAIGTPAAPALIAQLKTGTSASRADAIDALNQIGDIRSVPQLIKLLDAPDQTTRALAADALAATGDDRVVKALENALHDENHNVRELAGISLTRLRSPLAVPQLLAVFKDDHEWDASDAIADMGRCATAPLNAAIKDPDPGIRRLAAKSLEKIGGSVELWSVFATALRKEDLPVLAGAYLLFIRTGDYDFEDLLVRTLEQYGDQAMAEDFLSSKNVKLEGAAKTWAAAHNLQIQAHESAVTWGSGAHLVAYGVPHTMKETAEQRQRMLDHLRSGIPEPGL